MKHTGPRSNRINNIHTWLALRLTVVLLVLSVASGFFVHLLGNAWLYTHLGNMAETESAKYRTQFLEYLQVPSAKSLILLRQRIAKAIAEDNFVALRLLDLQSKVVAQTTTATSPEFEEFFSWSTRTAAVPETPGSTRLTLDGETYMAVSYPLMSATGHDVGRLDGIYRAPIELVAEIKRQSYGSIVLVIATILLTGLVLYPVIISLHSRLAKSSKTLALTNIGLLKVLGNAIAKRDSDTNIHNYRVTLYCVRFGEQLDLSRKAMQGLIKGAFLHDVGKIAISDRILLKPGRLTDDEFAVMKTHVQHGEDIITGYAWLGDAREVVHCHHEKYDGSGYPNQIAGEAIPRNARIFAIADIFDAITSRRAYKEPVELKVAVEIVRGIEGSHLDPALTKVFLTHVEMLYEEIFVDDEQVLHHKLEESLGRYFDQNGQ